MTGSVGAPGPSSELGASDLLMHRGEANPRIRSGIMALEVLDSTPDWDQLRARFGNASRKVLRLRQKVVIPTLPTEPALAGGGAATLLHLSHAVTDGVGAATMFAESYDLVSNPPDEPAPPMPVPQDLSPNDPIREGINQLPRAIVGGIIVAVSGGLGLVGRIARSPGSALFGAIDYARSGCRLVRFAAEPSPLLRRRSLSTRTEAIEMRLGDLHRTARAVEGSINDAYLAGLCGALRCYHEVLGGPINSLPIAVPVNLRAEADPASGNRFAGVNLAAQIGVADPAVRIQKIRKQMIQRREEAAIDVIDAVAPLLALLPDAALGAVSGSLVASDVQASNVPNWLGDTYIAVVKVLRQCGIGPSPGVASMVVLISRGDAAVTARYGRSAIAHPELLGQCLGRGFDEVLALAPGRRAREVPASFPDHQDQPITATNGSAAYS